MRTIQVNSLIVLMFSLLFVSCNSKTNKSFLPTASGNPYEVLVVCDANIWEGEAGKALFSILNSDIPQLPQSEAMFKITHCVPAHFDQIMKPIRNVVLVDIDPTKYTQGKLSYTKDVWSSGQYVIYAKAPNKEELTKLFERSYEPMATFFSGGEIIRSVQFLEKKHNSDARERIKKMFGITLHIPGDIRKGKEGDNFIWFSNDVARGRLDIVVYATPYRSVLDFSRDSIIAHRDSVMKKNVAGSFPNSYMRTANVIDPLCDTISARGRFCVETSGLWDMKGDMMGGPFISHTVLDETNHRLITVEGFVFAPEMDKRNLIRRLHAALFTLRFEGENNTADNIELGVNIEKE